MAKTYAVLKIGGKQYIVSPGEQFQVDKLPNDQPQAQVLLVVDGDKVAVGRPVVDKAKVSLKVLEPIQKGEKVEVIKFKAKSRYTRHIGFRPTYTKLQVEKISLSK